MRIILNSPGKVELRVFSRLEQEGLVDIISCLTWTLPKYLEWNVILKGPIIINNWQVLETGLKADFDSVDQRLFTPELKNELNWAEEIVMDMMDRIDPYKYQTHFDRKILYKFLVCYWLQKLSELKPSLFYTRISPHEVNDFVLFALCKHFNIKVLMFNPISIPGYQIISQDYRFPWIKLTEKSPRITIENNDFNLPSNIQNPDFQLYIEKLRINYDKAKPQYFVDGKLAEKQAIIKNKSIISSIKRVILHAIQAFLKLYSFVFSPNRIEINQNISRYMMLKQLACSLIVQNEFRMLPKIYKRLQNLDLNNKHFIYFLLHYQPENTTCPLGGIFNDQHMAVALLANAIPEGWKIYVKEHPQQYDTALGQYGYLGRDKTYYNRLKAIPNVEIIPIDSDHFRLLDNSMAVSTITGTVGWEAITRGKSVIIFGESWYQEAPNVYKVSTSVDCERAVLTIMNHRHTNYSLEFNNFVNAISLASVKIFFEDFEARWAGEEYNIDISAETLYSVIKEELVL